MTMDYRTTFTFAGTDYERDPDGTWKRVTALNGVRLRTAVPYPEVSAMLEAIYDMQATLDLADRANAHAVERWRTQHPDRALVRPDQANLVGFLLEREDRLRAVLEQVRPHVTATLVLALIDATVDNFHSHTVDIDADAPLEAAL
jgi:hypothetical protein